MAFFKEKVTTDSRKIEEVLIRGVEEVIVRDDLEKRLLSGEKLRIKHGIDPTGPKIHIGRATQFWKLKEFQELGHQVVLIIGDFTAQIGDASDKEAMRSVISEKEVKENMKDYLPQIGKILDVERAEVRYNSEWLGKMSAKELLALEMKFTAQQLIQRRNFKERWEQGKEIGLHELSYPLLQGYDSVAVRADVEIGGSDQLFNLLAGRQIQETFKQKPQNIITLKMLDGLDGRKMSTSWGNVININDEANDMFGKIMSMKDDMLEKYFFLATQLSLLEVEEKKKRLGKGENPRDLKMELAHEIVKTYYDERAADQAQENFVSLFQKKETPEEIPEVRLEKPEDLVKILMNNNLIKSKSEFRRLVKEGAIKMDGEVIKDPDFIVEKSGVIRVGKRRFIKIIVSL